MTAKDVFPGRESASWPLDGTRTWTVYWWPLICTPPTSGGLGEAPILELNPSLFKIPRMFCLLHWNLEDTALFWFFTIAVIIFIFAKTIQWFSFKQIKNMEANTRKRLWCCIPDGSIWKAIPFYFLNSFPPKYFSFKEISISF